MNPCTALHPAPLLQAALRRLPRRPEVPRRRPPLGAVQGAGIESQVRRVEGALRRSHERQPILSHRHEQALRGLFQCQGGQLQAQDQGLLSER